MRDLLITMLVVGFLPFCFTRPWIGILVWSWLGYMNPHRFTWGFAYAFPFAQLVAIATLAGLVFTKDRRLPPASATIVIWLLLALWFCVTTLFAFYPELAVAELDRTMKIQLFSFLTIVLITDKQRLHWLVWVIVVSLAFFGVKGGFFAAITGGNYLVWGPDGSFFEDNNAVGLVLIMMLPLAHYLAQTVERRSFRWGIYGGMALSGVAILSTHSRGALLAASTMMIMLWYKSEKKLATGVAMLIMAPVAISFMPKEWFDRMETITDYQEDASAMGRINAWWFAFNLALDRPVVGGGFQTFSKELFAVYAPDPEADHDAHSIYFEMLGEQGFVGLGLFLLLALLVYRMGSRIQKTSKDRPDLLWAGRLARALQVSMVGYAVGGAFLGLAYFDLYYHLLAMMVVTYRITKDEMSPVELAPRHRTPSQTRPIGELEAGRAGMAMQRLSK